MAKGLRSSVKKSNRSKLRARVFQPTEDARLERLHQKLLETAQQPKPETAKEKEMDIDSAEGKTNRVPPPNARIFLTFPSPTDAAENDASKEEDLSKGSFSLSARIPQSLHSASTSADDDDLDSRTLYHLLGLCSDVVGFSIKGRLEFAFDHPLLSMDS